MLHGALSYLLQDADGQVAPTHSISAGLDYPGVGPEHAYLKDAELATLRQRDGRGGARRAPAPRADRGHHRRAGALARDRLAPAVARSRRERGCSCACRAAATRTSTPSGRPWGPDERARSRAASRPRPRRSLLRPVRDRRLSRGRRGAAPRPRGGRRGRRRGRHPAFRPDHGRRRDPGGVLGRRSSGARGLRTSWPPCARPALRHPGRRDDLREPGAPPGRSRRSSTRRPPPASPGRSCPTSRWTRRRRSRPRPATGASTSSCWPPRGPPRPGMPRSRPRRTASSTASPRTASPGCATTLGGAAREVVGALRPLTDLPLLVGVGIGTPEQAAEACAFADGVIVGSALMAAMAGEGARARSAGLAASFRGGDPSRPEPSRRAFAPVSGSGGTVLRSDWPAPSGCGTKAHYLARF